ncbi:epimerase [Marisediminicola sp. LYQ85]|uniref:epimerase n=1 Tax=Marisediminicola sp. LYQ85 TaxID=3391062 RepID=UPI0039839389
MNDSAPTAVIAGASGFIGSRLVADFTAEGYRVVRIGRAGSGVAVSGDAAPEDVAWSDGAAVRRAVDGAEIVVNLAGKSVNCRYTDRNRDEILNSRLDTTGQLREAIAASATPPRVWLNASTATIYRYSLDRPMTESGGELGTGFSSDIAREWEAEFFEGDLPGTRRVALRMSIVLGDGPATSLLLRLARLGLGGPQLDGWWFGHRRYRGIGQHPSGDGTAPRHRSRGRQKFSWVHIDDVAAAVRFIRDTDGVSGPVNVTAPNPIDNRTLMRSLRRVVGARVGLPAFRWMLEPAMFVLRTEPELVLKSRWVLPGRLAAHGFTFAWPEFEPAAADAADRTRH